MPADTDPDRLADLEAERAFLLQSLRDLDAEYAAGDVDEHDFATLRDGYTKRAADVLREIEAGKERLRARPPTPWSRRLAAITGVVLVAVVAGWLVARSSGQRVPDDTSRAAAAGGDVASVLAEARVNLGTDPRRALELYGQVLEQQPEHPEALTYTGWLIYTVGLQADASQRAELVERARSELAAAVAADPDYADPHCFLAIIAANVDDDRETARAEGERCLALDAPGQLRVEMEPFLAGLTPPSTDTDATDTPDTTPE